MRVSPDALAGLLRPPPPKPKQPTSRERAAATHPARLQARQASNANALHPDPQPTADALLQALAAEAAADAATLQP